MLCFPFVPLGQLYNSLENQGSSFVELPASDGAIPDHRGHRDPGHLSLPWRAEWMYVTYSTCAKGGKSWENHPLSRCILRGHVFCKHTHHLLLFFSLTIARHLMLKSLMLADALWDYEVRVLWQAHNISLCSVWQCWSTINMLGCLL